jgi:D-sedoheptulose 7-phosphate isomerase
MTKFINHYFSEINQINNNLNKKKIKDILNVLLKVKQNNGRIFFIGVGGSAGNASHAVNDFRKLCNIDSLAPTDNVSELSARTNDDGWENVFSDYLKVSKLSKKDCIFLLSVGGGSKINNISVNLIKAVDYALKIGCKICGIVGKKDGYVVKKSQTIFTLPEVDKNLITPLAESYQSIILHCLVSHPKIKSNPTKW